MAADNFLKIDGIDGDSTDDKHGKWIELSSFGFGLNQTGTGESGSAHGSHASGKVSFQEFRITKQVDAGSPLLALTCALGKHIPTITLECCRAMGEKVCYFKVVLKDSIISSFQSGGGGGGGGVPTEQVSFVFGEVHWIYTPTDPKSGAKKGAEVKKGWSSTNNKEVAPG